MSSPGKSGIGYPGWRGLSSDNSRFNATWFLIQQALRLIHTATLVQVKACTNSGGLSPIGTVDVLPLVNMIDGLGQAQKHATVFGLPYFRLQGGSSAVILDPVQNDVGLAVIADRDISTVKGSLAQSNPGSRRKFSFSDGIYLGSVLSNVAPTQYVQFTSSGINLTDKNGNTLVMDTNGITINGVKFDRSQNVTNAANISFTNGKDFNGHYHSGVTTGSGNTGGPQG